jgi:hypothetical protein
MGVSTLTRTVKPMTIMGNQRIHKIKFTISNYGTDGISLTPAICGLSAIDAVLSIIIRTEVANGPVAGVWDETNKVIKFHKASNSGVDAGTVFNVDVVVMGS